MTTLARKLSLSQGTSLTLLFAAPAVKIAFNIQAVEPLGGEHFAIDITLTETPALLEVSKSRGRDNEPRLPERDTESDDCGENGERMPYHPARPRELRTGEVTGHVCDRNSRGPVS
jgi:hypothetical protein